MNIRHILNIPNSDFARKNATMFIYLFTLCFSINEINNANLFLLIAPFILHWQV